METRGEIRRRYHEFQTLIYVVIRVTYNNWSMELRHAFYLGKLQSYYLLFGNLSEQEDHHTANQTVRHT
jgi:hypothetical protein